MLKKSLKILFGLGLVPFCLGFTWQIAATLFSVHYRPNVPYYFLAGGLSYLTIHFLFRKPIFTYAVGHELTHAFFAALFGGSIKSFHASDKGGSVTITKSNFIITLAPYFFPLYTFLALILYWIVGAANMQHQGTAHVLVFLAGAAFAFHLVLTLIFLQTDQNDIREHGAVFSYPLIYLFNVVFAAVLIDILLAENMDFLRFVIGGIMKSTYMLSQAVRKVYTLL